MSMTKNICPDIIKHGDFNSPFPSLHRPLKLNAEASELGRRSNGLNRLLPLFHLTDRGAHFSRHPMEPSLNTTHSKSQSDDTQKQKNLKDLLHAIKLGGLNLEIHSKKSTKLNKRKKMEQDDLE